MRVDQVKAMNKKVVMFYETMFTQEQLKADGWSKAAIKVLRKRADMILEKDVNADNKLKGERE